MCGAVCPMHALPSSITDIGSLSLSYITSAPKRNSSNRIHALFARKEKKTNCNKLDDHEKTHA